MCTSQIWKGIDFYPRPPRGGRQIGDQVLVGHLSFLSTPSARRATFKSTKRTQTYEFLSTPSARRATLSARGFTRHSEYFYPRPPRGGRQESFWGCSPRHPFLSTPSARRATSLCSQCTASAKSISIHALREEGDVLRIASMISYSLFLSTPSARRATYN